MSESSWFGDVTSNSEVIAFGTIANGTLTASALVIGTEFNGLGGGNGNGQGNNNGNHGNHGGF